VWRGNRWQKNFDGNVGVNVSLGLLSAVSKIMINWAYHRQHKGGLLRYRIVLGLRKNPDEKRSQLDDV
jgi:hypothetical protein